MLKRILIITILSFAISANASEIERFELQPPFEDAANITFTDEENIANNLEDYKGKVVLLNFWATWCAPCKNEMPALDALARSFEGEDIVIVPISIEINGIEKIKQFYNDKNIKNLPIFLDERGKSFHQFKLQALPTTLVIDKKGRVVAKILGEIDWNSKENQDYLLQLAN